MYDGGCFGCNRSRCLAEDERFFAAFVDGGFSG